MLNDKVSDDELVEAALIAFFEILILCAVLSALIFLSALI